MTVPSARSGIFGLFFLIYFLLLLDFEEEDFEDDDFESNND